VVMQRVSARVSTGMLVVATLCQPAAALAFDLNIGPFHLSLPEPSSQAQKPARPQHTPRSGRTPHLDQVGHSERLPYSDQMMRSEPAAPVTIVAPGRTENVSPAARYPVLAWPSLYDDVFWPRAPTPWRFDYQSIFTQTFAEYSPQRASAFCPYRASTDEIVTRLSREIMPDATQAPLLEQLATALAQANRYLIKSCPSEMPTQPAARLQLMEDQIHTMIMALDIVRPRLQDFERSLGDQQRARLNQAAAVGGEAVPTCKPDPTAVTRQLSRLEQAVRPTNAQRPGLAAVEDAFSKAAVTLDDNCSGVVPPTALGRLDAIESRLDMTWQAVQTIQVALANFQGLLSDEQKGRLNVPEIASTP
jgi:hypothetical protein